MNTNMLVGTRGGVSCWAARDVRVDDERGAGLIDSADRK
jgi:hypothetical protein